MANANETTFKDLQMDERYKKLERTLKMVLLKNADRRNTGAWPSISSINCDNLDTSCTAMSIQSSRVGSEVVASSTNFRNAVESHKKHHNGPRVNMVTSSENQFPTKKDATDDSAMMPPPRTPGISFGRPKRFGEESQRSPLLNMPLNPTRNNNGFAVSTPASSISSIIKRAGSMSIDSSTDFQGDNYERNVYEENASSNGTQCQKRSFSRWRVLLNDKGQLIIKGILECGKVARSKPVIRRLAPTSVQSIFKHTYHLQGNLVDERGDLPDYVRGKFFNGFPDDWENVYQVWRNYLSDGSRLSFRWPTPVTDSDDDIKSGITEISYRPEFDKYKKSVSPRKRTRPLRASTSIRAIVEEDAENRFDPNRCSCSHNASGDTPSEVALKPAETLSREHSKFNRDEDQTDFTNEENKKAHETSSRSLNTTDKVGASSLKDIIQEDKLNIIIDNLTNKNCSIEYINKIVEMFDGMKYLVSYQSTGENDSEKNNSVLQEKERPRSPKKKNRSTEENHNSSNAPSSKSRPKNLHNPAARIEQYENAPSAVSDAVASRITEKPYKDQHVGQTRRKLTKHDYDSSESENDYHDDNRRPTTYRLSSSHERMRRSRRHHKNYQNAIVTRTSVRYSEPEKSREGSHRARNYVESSASRNNVHDSSLSEEEPVVDRRVEPEKSREGSHRARNYVESSASRNNIHDSSLSEEEPVVDRRVEQKTPHRRAFTSPRKCKTAEMNSRRRVDHYDSSISITEDEEHHVEKSKAKDARKVQYDSSVSITEDEHGDIQGEGRRLEILKQYPVSNSRPIEPDSSRNVDSCADRRKMESSKYPESIFRPVDPVVSRNTPRQGTPRKMPAFAKPMVADHNRSARAVDPPAKNPVTNSVGMSNFVTEQNDDSAYQSSEIKRAKKSEVNRDVVETDSRKAYTVNRSNDEQRDQTSEESPEAPAPKTKTPQVRKKPVVVSSELTNINLKSHNWLNSSGGNENDKNAGNRPRVGIDRSRVNPSSNDAKNAPISQTTPVDTLPEPANIVETSTKKPTNRETNVALKTQVDKSSTQENRSEKTETPTDVAKETPAAEFGSQGNPKLLTAWVPAVVCDEEGDSKYHLIFEGKPLNEAGHVVNRKFATDFIRRRVTAKLVETINQEFYKLVGDLNDTKHVVPKELLKLCHSGCPGRISQFCEKWKNFTAEHNKTPLRDRPHNTSVDCLGVPTSSRGRRILPPLNYWAGERIATKDNKAVYSPGNSQQLSIPSSLENTIDDIRDKKSPMKAKRAPNSMDQNGKRTDEPKTTGAKKKDAEKLSPNKPALQSPSQPEKSRRTRSGKRRLSKNVPVTSSESEADDQTKPTPRKRKMRTTDQMLNTGNTPTRKLRNSSRNNTESSQSLENTNGSSGRGSFEKLPETELKTKLRKRQKIDYVEESSATPAISKQFLTRRNSMVTCTHYKNVPIRDDDLSEDQLSTM